MSDIDRQAAWQKAREKLKEMRASGWKPVHLNPLEAAAAKPNSLKLAIRAHCYQCVGEDSDPGYKARVRDCCIPKCALWTHRPWQAHAGEIRQTEEGIAFEGDDAPEDDAA